jgi:hypothetical protein
MSKASGITREDNFRRGGEAQKTRGKLVFGIASAGNLNIPPD